MDRKKLLKATRVGLGFALVPGWVPCQSTNVDGDYFDKLKPIVIRDEEGSVLNVIGDIQTHNLIGSETGNQIVEWVDNVEPGVGIPPNIHTREDEIFRVIKGQVEIMVNGTTTILNEGDVTFASKKHSTFMDRSGYGEGQNDYLCFPCRDRTYVH
tara:strand:- start:270 stop:734 length:465 start_codon:yes stop_codon:yes gene_type:complete